MTKEDILKAMEECEWHKMFEDIHICSGYATPCVSTIKSGLCVAMAELYQREEVGERREEWQED